MQVKSYQPMLSRLKHRFYIKKKHWRGNSKISFARCRGEEAEDASRFGDCQVTFHAYNLKLWLTIYGQGYAFDQEKVRFDYVTPCCKVKYDTSYGKLNDFSKGEPIISKRQWACSVCKIPYSEVAHQTSDEFRQEIKSRSLTIAPGLSNIDHVADWILRNDIIEGETLEAIVTSLELAREIEQAALLAAEAFGLRLKALSQ